MKKLLYLSFSFLLFFSSCQKTDTNLLLEANKEMSKGPAGKVTICHQVGNGKVIVLEVSQNALAAHLAHGDIVPDSDGDGYTAIGSCTGSVDDCNDNDAAINPGAEEVCGDGKDNNCNGLIDENCVANFEVFNISNASGTFFAPWDADILLNENEAGDGFSYTLTTYGQSVGYGTKFFDGQKLNSILRVNFNSVNRYVPELEIYVTDGTGNYAIISTTAKGVFNSNNYFFIENNYWYIKDYAGYDLNWLINGNLGFTVFARPARINGIFYPIGTLFLLDYGRIVRPLSLSDFSDRIVIGEPADYPYEVPFDSPRSGYGFNLVKRPFFNRSGESGQITGLTITDTSGKIHIARN